MNKNSKKIKLYGFNNLTKNLNFCIYNIFYINSTIPKKTYINYINKKYNTNKLLKILKKTCLVIGAKILNIAKQDYKPQGASITLLISEEIKNKKTKILTPKNILAHLNKSHLCIHTYPEIHPKEKICTIRIDIEISTCGIISPLKILNYLINKLKSDIITIDYRIRGFTRDKYGKKYFIDHKIKSIQNFLENKIKKIYDMIDTNIHQENIFHTRMILKYINIKNYLFKLNHKKIKIEKKNKIISLIWKEMSEIYYSKNK